ncbi:unnamed protein product [Didymodactylos carnosus]|uniref:NHL repeat-containing protein n=1 Tax=Didymodactylos carnosus TaxID=1234261 RepID=A0A8S2WWL9_9BILA|nr:unnamed protein product [Didymodactylos carnosus]
MIVTTNLSLPTGIFVDQCDTIYVAAFAQYFIIKFTKNNSTGIIVTGIPGEPGSDMNHLWFPHDVILDPYGNLYIADSSNRRIQRLSAKDGLMETIVDDGGSASEHLDSSF